MSFLAPLFEIQDLDLAADAARGRISTLPERARAPELERKRAEIDAALAAAEAERAARGEEEERLGREVTQVARDIEHAEVERYSGKRFDQDEAKAHDASQAALRAKQAELEEQEMALLEAMEEIEARFEEQTAARAANRAEAEKVQSAIQQAEAEVEVELARILTARGQIESRVPDAIRNAYERLRQQSRSGGRGAAGLAEGRCTACRIKLPSLEYSRMQAEPEDALIQCPQCRRVLVRE